jgi:HD superfamily phosphohydrolase YqeK
MTNLEQASRQAMEALEVIPFMSNKNDYEHLNKTITALHQALEQQPAREWVELTDEEIYEAIWPLCTSDNQVVKSLVELSMDEYRAIEKALKEKNT